MKKGSLNYKILTIEKKFKNQKRRYWSPKSYLKNKLNSYRMKENQNNMIPYESRNWIL